MRCLVVLLYCEGHIWRDRCSTGLLGSGCFSCMTEVRLDGLLVKLCLGWTASNQHMSQLCRCGLSRASVEGKEEKHCTEGWPTNSNTDPSGFSVKKTLLAVMEGGGPELWPCWHPLMTKQSKAWKWRHMSTEYAKYHRKPPILVQFVLVPRCDSQNV